VDGLLFLRLGGEYHDKPILWAQWIGLGHLVLATLVMMALERKSRSSETRELLKSRRFR